jgi:hypothetical protein
LHPTDFFGKQIKIFYGSCAVLPQVGVLWNATFLFTKMPSPMHSFAVFSKAWAFEKVGA